MKRLATVILAALAASLAGVASGQATADARHQLPVTKGLACWYDAAVGVTTDAMGVVQAWHDLSGNDHFATRAAGAPRLALNQIQAKPAVQFRTAAGACGIQSRRAVFRGRTIRRGALALCRLEPRRLFSGRRWARNSSYRLGVNTAAFWGDQYPDAVSKNGKKIGDRPFVLAPITDYMLLKIDVNDGDMSRNTYQIGMADMASCDCDVAEIVGYQTRLLPADEALVGGYLAAKYGISTAYPPYTGRTANVPNFRPGPAAVDTPGATRPRHPKPRSP